ncbi:MAG: SMP-30/gluconolactonase/LRE family protein [Actinomycetota bacterium]
MSETASNEWTELVGGVDFGEGPRWHEGELWYSDFYHQRVYRVGMDGQRTTVLELHDRPSGLGWLPNGDLLVVSMTARQVLRHDGEIISVHAELGEFAPANCNDMIVDATGNAYVGHFGFDLEARADFAPASLLLVRPDGSVEVAAADMAFPNGTVITPDGRTLICGQSFGGDYVAFDIEDDATLTNRRQWAAIPGTAPDGCTLDAAGGIWFSDARGDQVIRVVEGGEVTDRIPTPQPTFACMLGGPDGRTLFALCAVGSHPDQVAGSGAGAIVMQTVEHPKAGLP